MSDRIALRGVEVRTVIGVFERERTAPRTLLVDLEIDCSLAAAAASDAVEDTIDYLGLVERVRELCEKSSFRLIEALATRIAELCVEEPTAVAARVTVHKAGALERVGDVAVTIERRRTRAAGA